MQELWKRSRILHASQNQMKTNENGMVLAKWSQVKS